MMCAPISIAAPKFANGNTAYSAPRGSTICGPQAPKGHASNDRQRYAVEKPKYNFNFNFKSFLNLLWVLLLAAFFKALPFELFISLVGMGVLLAALFWPKLTSLKRAEQAARIGAGVCFLIAAITTLTVLGGHPWELVEVLICVVAGWRVWRLSRIWAVLILVLYAANFCLNVSSLVSSSDAGFEAGIIMFVVIAVGLIGGVRGTFAYQAIKKKESAASWATAGGSQ
jgi:hypothetical protein